MLYGPLGARLHTYEAESDDILGLVGSVGVIVATSDETILAVSTDKNVGTASREVGWLWKIEFAGDIKKRFDHRASVETDLHDSAFFFNIGFHFD